MSKNDKRPIGTGRDSDKQVFDKDKLPDKIGQSLKSLYDEVLAEDVPDDFLNLLRKADDASDKTDGEASK